MRAGTKAVEDDIATLPEQITSLIEPWQPALIILGLAISEGYAEASCRHPSTRIGTGQGTIRDLDSGFCISLMVRRGATRAAFTINQIREYPKDQFPTR